MSYDFGALDERIQRLLSRFGAAACGAELVCDGDLCGHITTAARIWNRDCTQVLQVWSAKNERWQLPGAHGDADLDLAKVAEREARRSLVLPLDAELRAGEVSGVNAEGIAEYWNTPAHIHLEIVFEFWVEEAPASLPTGARWGATP